MAAQEAHLQQLQRVAVERHPVLERLEEEVGLGDLRQPEQFHDLDDLVTPYYLWARGIYMPAVFMSPRAVFMGPRYS